SVVNAEVWYHRGRVAPFFFDRDLTDPGTRAIVAATIWNQRAGSPYLRTSSGIASDQLPLASRSTGTEPTSSIPRSLDRSREGTIVLRPRDRLRRCQLPVACEDPSLSQRATGNSQLATENRGTILRPERRVPLAVRPGVESDPRGRRTGIFMFGLKRIPTA